MTKHAPLRLKRLPIPAALARGFATAGLLLPSLALAGGGPSGGVVVGGHATISNPAPNGTVITETSNSAIINWQQFSIGNGDYVQLIQPSSSSVVLNRVIGGSPSQIFGDLSANGRVFLINPNGVLFGKGAQLDVGGLVASTMNISNADFLAGHYIFSGGSAPGSSVVNAGTIKTADGGFVVLAGDYVNNTGVIQARLGQVVLASGAATTLDLDGSGLVSFAVNQATLAKKAGVNNAGQIIADGGRVIMTAQTAHDLVGSAVNNTGLVQAQGIANHNGEIELTASGGDITDSGTIDASNPTGAGGTVTIAGDHDIDIQNGAQILASGSTGGKVSIVADGTLATRAGSVIDALGSAGKGGYAELSGHGLLTMRGAVNLGSGGTLLIDPTSITIAAGTGASGSAGGNDTVFQNFIQNQLQGGVNVQLVAGSSITLADLGSGGKLNGVGTIDGAPYGGSLLLGIGSVNANGAYVEGSGGTISFLDLSNSIATVGGLTIDAGSASGTVNVGNLTGGFVKVKGLGGISVGTVTASSGSLNLNASSGNIAASDLSATGPVQVSAGGGSLVLGNVTSQTGSIAIYNTAGSVTTQNLETNPGQSANATDVDILVRSAGALSVGSVSTYANTSAGDTSATVDLEANYYASNGGALTVNGPISTYAYSYTDPLATVTLNNNDGDVNLGSNTVSTYASHDPYITANTDDSIRITATKGNITVGNLTAQGGSSSSSGVTSNIALSTNGSGNIKVGSISGGSNNGLLNSISLSAAGSLAVSGDLNAESIQVASGAGNLALGNLTASNGSISVSDSAGSVTTQNLSASTGRFGNAVSDANITVDSAGGLSVGSVTTSAFNGNGQDTSATVDLEANYYASNGGDLIVNGAISTSAHSSLDPLATVTLVNRDGNVNLGSNTITTSAATRSSSNLTVDDSITLSATNGAVTAGNLQADSGNSNSPVTNNISVTATGSGGNIKLGSLSGGSDGSPMG